MPANGAGPVSREAAIAAGHPCLSGHFPGNPVVPGVLLLDTVGEFLREWKPGCRIAGIAQAKFHRPLRPGQRVTVTLYEQNPHSVKFECFRESEKIASGLVVIEFRP